MLNLLNAIEIFGKILDWPNKYVMIGMIAIQALFVLFALILIISLLKSARAIRKRRKAAEAAVVQTVAQPAVQKTEVIYVKDPKTKVERMLTGITLDVRVVQREFKVKEKFNCTGLVVRAEYNTEPTSVSYVDFTLVDNDEYVKLEKRNKLHGVYVIYPNMTEVGKKTVTVRYGNQLDVYTIDVQEEVEPVVQAPAEPTTVVVEKVVEKPVVVEKIVEVEKPATKQIVETVIIDEESVEAGRLRYDKSFEARLIQSEDETKHWYTEIKNELLSYKTCKGRISWKRETFKAKKEVVAKLVFRGNTLCVFLPLNYADYEANVDVETTDLPTYEETPVLIRIKNEKRKRLALELIGKVMTDRGILHGTHTSEDFYVPYEGVLELINKGLIKREIRTVNDEAIFDIKKEDDD